MAKEGIDAGIPIEVAILEGVEEPGPDGSWRRAQRQVQEPPGRRVLHEGVVRPHELAERREPAPVLGARSVHALDEARGLDPELERLDHLAAQAERVGRVQARGESATSLDVTRALGQPPVPDGEGLVASVAEAHRRLAYHGVRPCNALAVMATNPAARHTSSSVFITENANRTLA